MYENEEDDEICEEYGRIDQEQMEMWWKKANEKIKEVIRNIYTPLGCKKYMREGDKKGYFGEWFGEQELWVVEKYDRWEN